MNTKSNRYCTILRFLHDHWAIVLVMVLLFCQRVSTMMEYGIAYNLGSDDLAYVQSGINLVETHVLSLRSEYPSAQIMPGLPSFFAIIYLIFGDGTAFWITFKILFFIMASFTAYYVYRSVILYAPKWCGVLAVLPFLRTDFSWMNNTPLSETPFLLAFTATVYYSMKYAKEKNNRDFYISLVTFMLGFLIRANLITFPLFFLVYLLILNHKKKDILIKGVLYICVLLLFVVPWSIRNYYHFDAFIPISYGSGHPMLLGTFQGINYPPDVAGEHRIPYEVNYTLTDTVKHPDWFKEPSYEPIDYVTPSVELLYTKFHNLLIDDDILWIKPEYENIDDILRIKPEYEAYVTLEQCALLAKLRMQAWLQEDPVSFLYSYLYVKPSYMINSAFYWGEYLGQATDLLRQIPLMENLVIFILCIFLLVLQKENKSPFFFPLLLYLGIILTYSIGFSFERYNATVVSAKYIALGIGIGIASKFPMQVFHKIREINSV